MKYYEQIEYDRLQTTIGVNATGNLTLITYQAYRCSVYHIRQSREDKKFYWKKDYSVPVVNSSAKDCDAAIAAQTMHVADGMLVDDYHTIMYWRTAA